MYWNYLGTGSRLQWFVVQVFPEPAVVSLYLSVWDGFFTHEFIQFLCELLHVASICNSLWLWVNVNYHLLSSLNLPPSFTWSFSFGWHPIALALEQTMIFFFPLLKSCTLPLFFGELLEWQLLEWHDVLISCGALASPGRGNPQVRSELALPTPQDHLLNPPPGTWWDGMGMPILGPCFAASSRCGQWDLFLGVTTGDGASAQDP